jgi:hypothetical protein
LCRRQQRPHMRDLLLCILVTWLTSQLASGWLKLLAE